MCFSRATTSCQDALNLVPSAPSGVYNITLSGSVYPQYCVMSGSSGWTLLLKMDGSASTFYYDNAIWTNTAALNVNAYISGIDNTEYKSPASVLYLPYPSY